MARPMASSRQPRSARNLAKKGMTTPPTSARKKLAAFRPARLRPETRVSGGRCTRTRRCSSITALVDIFSAPANAFPLGGAPTRASTRLTVCRRLGLAQVDQLDQRASLLLLVDNSHVVERVNTTEDHRWVVELDAAIGSDDEWPDPAVGDEPH